MSNLTRTDATDFLKENGFLDGDGIEFGYNKPEDKEKTLNKVKEYIDAHYNEIMDCGLDIRSVDPCACYYKCDIFKKEKK